MSHRTLVVLLCLVAVANLSGLGQSWTAFNGPSVAIAPKDISCTSDGITAFMAESGYVLKSTNSGTSWTGTREEYADPDVVQVKLSDCTRVVAAKGGEIVASTNAGQSWHNRLDAGDLVPLTLFNVINDNKYMLVGSEYVAGKSPVRQSTDAGWSWDFVNFPYEDGHPDIRDFSSYPQTGHDRNGVVWACGSDHNGTENGTDPDAEALDRGLWFSPNYGADWYGNFLGDFNLRSIAVGSAVNKWADYVVIVVVQDDENGDYLKRSAYSGNGPWNDVTLSPAPNHIYRIRRNRNDGYFYLATDIGVFQSTNGGTSFSQMNNGLGSDLDVKEVDAQNVAGLVYAATTKGVYKTTDSGANWSFASYMNASTVASGSTVWSASRDNAFVGWTTDSGSNWIRSSFDYSGANAEAEHAFRVPANSHYLVAGKGDHGATLFRSTTVGGTLDDYYCPSNSDDGRFYHLGVDLTASNNNVYLCGGTHVLDNNNTVWKNDFFSTDLGVTWNYTSWNIGSGTYYVIDYIVINTSTRYAMLSNGQVYVTTNGGTNWNSSLSGLASPGTGYSLAMSPGSTNTVYAGRSDGLWKNSGSGWDHKTSSAAVKRVVMHPGYPSSSNYLFILEENGGTTTVSKSTNGGTNFTSIGSRLPKVNDIECNPTSGCLSAATEQGVFRYDIQPAPPQNLTGSTVNQHPHLVWNANVEVDIDGYKIYSTGCNIIDWNLVTTVGSGTTSYTDETRTVHAGGDGDFFYYVVAIDGNENVSIPSNTVSFECRTYEWKVASVEPALPKVIALHSSYPNPFNPSTEMRFDLPGPATVSLAIYDLLGRKVGDLVSGRYEAGYHSAVWNAADMASGVYLARFTVVNELGSAVYTKTNKLVLMK